MALSSLFPFSDRARALHAELERFIAERVLPAEAAYDAHLEQPGQRWTIPPIMEALKIEAQQRGLWNLFLPDPIMAPACRCSTTRRWPNSAVTR